MEKRLLDFQTIEQIYDSEMKRDFPPAELKPLKSIQSLMQRGIYRGFGWYEGENLQGYAFLVELEGCPAVMLDYFAVSPNGRGQGTGSRLLADLATSYGEKGILIEAEDPASAPDPETANRRIRFYERCGTRFSGWKGWVFDVWYRLFILGGTLTGEEARDAMSQMYQTMLPPEIFREKVSFFPAES